MSAALTVAAAQINPELGQIKQNLELHSQFIRQANEAGADLLLFPELSLTGYQVGRDTLNLALAADDPALLQLSEIAGEMTVAVGFVEQAKPGQFFNALALLRQGRVIHLHRKLNLPTYGGLEEGKWFSPGEQLGNCQINTQWQSSQLICADLWNPALVHCAMLQQPELLLAPINSASAIVSDEFSNERNWLTNLEFYAMTYGTPIVMANRFGPELGAHFWGGSRILGPRGEILAAAEDGEQLISATLELSAINQARFELPTVRDANTPLIRKILSQL